MAKYRVPRKFERALVKSLKDTILRIALVDTGALYDSIEVQIDVVLSARSVDLIIQVSSEDYAKYLVEPFDILGTWESETNFNEVIGDVIIDYTNFLFDSEGIRTAVNIEYNLEVRLNNSNWFYQG